MKLAFVLEDKQHGAIPILQAAGWVAHSDGNKQLVAAVSGQVIRVLSLIAYSWGGTTTLTMCSSSSGSLPIFANIPANTSAEPNLILAPSEFGWFDTAAGQGLFMAASADTIEVSVRYAVYEP